MRVFVGAYAASPCYSSWNPQNEEKFLKGLAEIPGIAGLELPFYGALHRFDSEWLLDHLRPEWDYILTCLPGTMDRLKVSPHFGLASEDESGRREALLFVEQARIAIQRIHGRLGRKAMRAIEVHSAPQLGASGVRSSEAALTRSLQELGSWDWQGVEIWVEHCDRAIQGQVPAKGFLSLEEELSSVLKAGQAGILINWARSAIEGRSAEIPAQHLLQAREAGLLKALFFSGCTVNDALYGTWADSHAPFWGKEPFLASTSLLTLEKIQEALQIAHPEKLSALGMKIQALPHDLSVEDRLERVKRWVSFLQNAIAHGSKAPSWQS